MTHPYATRAYADALAFVGTPLWLPGSESWAFLRSIPGSDRLDAIGAYPFAPTGDAGASDADWSVLRAEGAISFVSVTDVRDERAEARGGFDWVRPFKTHFLFDAHRPAPPYTRHHRHTIRRALRDCTVRVVSYAEWREAWKELYAGLVARHGLAGIHGFGDPYFDRLADVPGLVTIAAFAGDTVVSMHLWMTHAGWAYSHLAASSALGYRIGASYAGYDFARHYFRDQVIDLGGVSGVADDPANGLDRVKRGFANGEGRAHLCAKVLDPTAYHALTTERGATHAPFFPEYRAVEAACT